MKTVLALVVFAVVLILAALGFIYSGLYNVAASDPHAGVVEWALEKTQERSVHRASEGIEAPPLDDPGKVRTGLIHYHEMCVTCHGAPGVQMSEIGMGLNPVPPELAAEAAEEEPGEMFWVIKNGIKMTGMPAFGVTHDDDAIWAIVAFLNQLPRLSPDEYQALVREAGLQPGASAGHMHGGESPDEGAEDGSDHPHPEGTGEHGH
jgi:mono/diheme cytochrome c family protein